MGGRRAVRTQPLTLRVLGSLLVPVAACVLLASVAVGTGRPLAAVLAAVATAFGLALAWRARHYERAIDTVSEIGERVLALLPGVFVVWFSFNGGGYFPASQAFAALVLALVLALRFWFASDPLAGFGRWTIVGAAALGMYAVWTVLSGGWSHAPGLALLEFNRVLLYLLAFLLFASLARSTQRIRLMVRGVAGGIVLVCAIGLITRVLPDVWHIAPDMQQGRLSYPITYWNALGLLAALGLVLCLHLASSEKEPWLGRVLGASAMPVLGATLLFTFSRGGIAVAVVGLVAYALIARPRGLVGALLAAGPATALAVHTAYDAGLLASDYPTLPQATAQGHHVATVVLLCTLGAAAIRLATLPLDRALASIHLPLRWRRMVPALVWVAGAAAAVLVFFGANGPHRVSTNYDRFVKGNAVVQSGDLRARLGDPGNNRRIDQWKVALKGYHDDRFQGLGAGTYQNLWAQRRPTRFEIRDAHSLYTEVMGELGLTGLLLLAAALALMMFGFVRAFVRGRDRYVYGALIAAALAWLVRAALDWDWEMPALTAWLFCAGGAALAVTGSRRRSLRVSQPVRLALATAALAVALVPAAVTVSEHRLNAAETAFARGDCATAEGEAQRSLDVVGFRAEPQEVIAYCASARLDLGTALGAAQQAVRRDPGNWRYHYVLALVQAARGEDGLPEARAAQALNPLEPTVRKAIQDLAAPDAKLTAQEELSDASG
jgi:O-antigen ligase